jgi:hypothetical protein
MLTKISYITFCLSLAFLSTVLDNSHYGNSGNIYSGIQKKENDSVSIYYKMGISDSSLERQAFWIQTAIRKAKSIQNDSIRQARLSYLSLQLTDFKNKNIFLQANSAAVESSVLLNDSLALANAYWDRGDFYMHQFVQDSSYLFYSKAQEVFEAQGEAMLSARMRIQMAIGKKP